MGNFGNLNDKCQRYSFLTLRNIYIFCFVTEEATVSLSVSTLISAVFNVQNELLSQRFLNCGGGPLSEPCSQ